MKTHGDTKTPEYRAYISAKDRCTNKKNPHYSYYGGRGIKFCFNNYVDFITEVGHRLSSECTLDRIDTNKNYEKGNIRWATRKIQQGNRRNNISFRGKIARDASRELGGHHTLVQKRLSNGWSLEDAFTKPLQRIYAKY